MHVGILIKPDRCSFRCALNLGFGGEMHAPDVDAVDILVNNAAVLLGENDAVLSIAPDGYRRTFETNLFGVIEVCRAFVPGLARAGYGRVVNVSSGAGQLATMSAYAPAYSMSKRRRRDASFAGKKLRESCAFKRHTSDSYNASRRNRMKLPCAMSCTSSSR